MSTPVGDTMHLFTLLTGITVACLPGHIQMSSLVDRWHCGILGGQLGISPSRGICVN